VTCARVDVVVAGGGDAARRAAEAAARGGANVLLLPGGAVTALLRPADAVRGVCHRAADGTEAVVEAVAVVLAADDDGAHASDLVVAALQAGAVKTPEGLQADGDACVLDRSGLTIPGLYAASDAASGEEAGTRAAARAAARPRESDG
jgi:hypothetical protein